MDWTRIIAVCLALLIVTSPAALAGSQDPSKGRDGSSGAPTVSMGAPILETQYHDPHSAGVLKVDPYVKRLDPRQYRDGLLALAELRGAVRDPANKNKTTQEIFDLVLKKFKHAKSAFAAAGITVDNFMKAYFLPMFARRSDGKTIKNVIAIDKTKPVQQTSRKVDELQQVECPQEWRTLYLPACAYCNGWTSLLTQEEYSARWRSGAMNSNGAGVNGTGAQAPTYCCTPQSAGGQWIRSRGPCYQNVKVTIYDPEIVSIVRWPAQLVPVNGELVWKVQVPGNQVAPGKDLGKNQFINADEPTGNTMTLPVNPRTGEPTNLSASPPPTTGPDGKKVQSDTYYQKPPLDPKKKK